MKNFDHIIVGTGQALGTLLSKLIATGDTIAVIEGGEVGGSCVNFGCTPTKTLVASAKAFHQAKRGDFYGFNIGEPQLNYNRVRERMNEIRNDGNQGLTDWMEGTDNVTLFRGWASFKSPKIVVVGYDELTADKIYINTGTRPAAPPIDGLEEVGWLDSGGLLDLTELPEHLIIIGGGYIGMEFAQVYRRFGSEVTVVQRGGQVMPAEDNDVADAVQTYLEDEGVRILCDSSAIAADRKGGEVQLKIKRNGVDECIEGSHILVAAGRKPNADNLNLEAIGIEKNSRGFIQVDDHCQTNVKGVFALGDVNGNGAFTHTSVNDAEIVLDYLFDGNRTQSGRNRVYGLFTDPPLGRVGMSEKEARKTGKNVLMATRQMSKISRAKEMGETKGFVKILVDADTDMFLGVSILGLTGDEIISMFTAMIQTGTTWKEFRKTVLPHPTVSELMPWILDDLEPLG